MNGTDDDSLRAAFASLAGTPAPNEGRDCPEPERIHAAVRGELSPAEVRDVVEHVAVCPDCAEAWRLAAALEQEAATGAAAAAPPARRPSRFPRIAAVAATALVAVLAVGVWWTASRGPDGSPIYRDGEGAEIVSLLPEDEPLDRDEPVLRWRLAPDGPPAGTTYDVVVLAGDEMAFVAEARDLEEPRYEIPAESLAGVPPGSELLWTVEAATPAGRRVTSPTFITPVPTVALEGDRQ